MFSHYKVSKNFIKGAFLTFIGQLIHFFKQKAPTCTPHVLPLGCRAQVFNFSNLKKRIENDRVKK
jgi:hypothetical protein